jgi:hypothetical protein
MTGTNRSEHPTERARAALREASVVEGGELGVLMLRCADALPRRYGPAPKTPKTKTSKTPDNVVRLVQR